MLNISTSIFNINEFLESSEVISILVGQSDPDYNPNQLHCGIVYRFQNKFNVIHLAWHYYLKHDEESTQFSKYFFVKSTIHNSRQNSIAAMCRLILKRQREKKIPYGLSYSGGSFTKEGVLNLDSNESGLTCATFILAVFKSCEIKLIDLENWNARDSDTEWHNCIIQALLQTKDKFDISDKHIGNVKEEVGCARFRPEEVAISSAFVDIPGNSESIISYGSKLREAILS